MIRKIPRNVTRAGKEYFPLSLKRKAQPPVPTAISHTTVKSFIVSKHSKKGFNEQ